MLFVNSTRRFIKYSVIDGVGRGEGAVVFAFAPRLGSFYTLV